MKTKLYCFFDSKSSSYDRPCYSSNKGTAIRDITDLLKEDNKYSRHPSDYVLFEVGEFDSTTGLVVSYDAPQSCGVLSEFLNAIEK